MRVESFKSLSEKQIQEILALEELVHQHDGTYRDIYLDNRFNFDPEMPAFWLANDQNELVACLAIYADSQEDAELTVIVHPQYRRQSLASRLIKAAKEEMEAYGIEQHVFVSERSFLEKIPHWQRKFYWNEDEVEWLMECPAASTALGTYSYTIRLATITDTAAIAGFQAEAFDSSYEEALLYAEGALEDETHRLYVFENAKGELLGSTSVNLTEEYYYFFGLAIAAKFQNKGLAQQLIPQLMQLLWCEEPLPFRLAVEKENTKAIHIYQKSGFRLLTEVIYLYEKL